MEWKKAKLGTLVKQVRGVSYKKDEIFEEFKEGTIPLLRANNIIGEGKLFFDPILYVKEEKVKEEQLILKGDIVIAASSGSINIVGKPGQANRDLNKTFGAFCKLIRNKNEEILNTKYLGHFFNSPYYKRTIRNAAAGANINNLRNEHIDNLEIPVPPMEVQIKIASALDKAQELIDSRKAQIEKYDELLQAVFLDMFGDPVINPKGWEKGTIRDLLSEAKYGTSKKADEKNGEYPVLRMNNITYKGNWDFSSLKYVNLDENELEKYLVHKGDILFNRTNSKELVGKTAVYVEENSMAYAGYLVRLRTNKKANPHYISTYLNSHHGKLTLRNMCKSIVGMANINAQEVQDIKILHPPLDLQNQFASIVEKVEMEKKLCEESLKQMKENFNSIMQRAFRGEMF